MKSLCLAGIGLMTLLSVFAQQPEQPLTHTWYQLDTLTGEWNLLQRFRYSYLPTGEVALEDRLSYRYDPDGDPYRIERRFDEAGNLLMETHLSVPEGQQDWDTTLYRYFAYDADGHQTLAQIFSDTDSSLLLTRVFSYEYDEAGCLVRQQSRAWGSDQATGEDGLQPVFTHQYQREADCRLQVEEQTVHQADYFTRRELTYDARGGLKEIRLLGRWSQAPLRLQNLQTYTNDAQGRVLEMFSEIYHEDGDTTRERRFYSYADTATEPQTLQEERYIDSLGWVIMRSSEHFIGPQGQRRPLSSLQRTFTPGFAFVSTLDYTYDFDAEGKLLEMKTEERVTGNDTLMVETLTEFRYSYRCDGKLAQIRTEGERWQHGSFGQPPTRQRYTQREEFTYGPRPACDPQAENFALTVYPNPATDEAWLNSDLLHYPGTTVRLLALDGRVMQETATTVTENHLLKVGSLADGLYLLQLHNEDLGKTVNGKLMVGGR